MSYWNGQSPEDIQKQQDVTSFIMHVLCGVYSWELIHGLPFDWSLLRSRHVCKWGAAVYFMCRWTTAACLAIDLAIIDQRSYFDTLRFSFQATNAVAHGLALFILSGRIVEIWKKQSISISAIILQIALWVIIIRSVVQAGGVWQDDVTHLLLAAYLCSLETLWAILGFVGLHRLYRKTFPGTRGKAYIVNTVTMLYRQGCVYLMIPMFPCLSAMGVSILMTSVPLMYTTGMVAFVAVCTCACRTYQGMVLREDGCPMKIACGLKSARTGAGPNPPKARSRSPAVELRVLSNASGRRISDSEIIVLDSFIGQYPPISQPHTPSSHSSQMRDDRHHDNTASPDSVV